MAAPIPPVVLITGANQGLGFAIAEIFSQSKQPYTVLVGARDQSRGEEAVTKLLSKKTNDKITVSAIQINLASSESITTALESIGKSYGRIDVLVNNAGIFGAPGKMWTSTTRPDWRAIFEVNVFGAIELVELAFPLLRKSSLPRVIVVTSNMGSITKVSQGHVPCGAVGAYYSSSKAAINAMVANWTQLQKDIKFWAVCPGLVATEFGGDFTKQHGRDPKDAADIVRMCAEGEKDDVVGYAIWDQDGKSGVYEW
ncbi:short-chain dehydrogenase/reductase SDR [Bimuria novae-zelandiae CBS 107.79]|uniref:Short-chain dehydrogenase/reductase SDR n=1 Tax=Bimuria novae-zelandiae CBS 107.79 TaxID=1447943 RepID=A0A6A5UXV3_9PLEO|nr:short-chain dehydrogenase/reductase SDR [Bimuria novae-zelandiae CBS 107.79]